MRASKLVVVAGFARRRDESPLCDEATGLASYFVANHSRHDLIIEATTVAVLGPTIERVFLPAGSSEQLAEDSMYGINPTPSLTFSAIRIFAVGEPAILYAQVPVQNSRWRGGRVDSGELGVSEFWLAIRDDDLTPR